MTNFFHIYQHNDNHIIAVIYTLCLLWVGHCSKYFQIYYHGAFFFFFFFFLRAEYAAYGSSQARGQIRATAAHLLCSHSNTASKPHPWPHTTDHGNDGSLTHWERPGIESASSWILNWVRYGWATMGTLTMLIIKTNYNIREIDFSHIRMRRCRKLSNLLIVTIQ